MSRVTRSMTREKRQKEAAEKALEGERDIVKTIEEAIKKSKESLSEFEQRIAPVEKPTMVPDDFDDFDESVERQDKWELSEGSDWEDMDDDDALEGAILDDIATMSDLRF